MRYRTLGATGIEVSTHCLGTMMFGAVGNPDHDDCVRIIHAALDQGINFVDTADMYSSGESEEIVGKALKGRRDDVVLATKVHFPLDDEARTGGGNSRRWIIHEVEQSLRRLDTDWIDLYQVHRPDHRPTSRRPSRCSPTWSARARSAPSAARPSRPRRSSRRTTSPSVAGYGKFRTEQPPYSMIARGIERSVLPTAASGSTWAC